MQMCLPDPGGGSFWHDTLHVTSGHPTHDVVTTGVGSSLPRPGADTPPVWHQAPGNIGHTDPDKGGAVVTSHWLVGDNYWALIGRPDVIISGALTFSCRGWENKNNVECWDH